MNYYIRCSSAVLCTFLATGCSTNTKKQTESVSVSAIAYTELMNDLLNETKTHAIRLDSEQLGMSHSSKSREANKKMLDEKNEALDNWLAEVDKLRKQNNLLQNYFKALQAMVTDPERNDMTHTIGSISASISSINQAQAAKHGGESKLGGLDSNYVGNLSQTLISWHYAKKVRKVFMRDINIINKQIASHEIQLEKISKIYKRNIRFDNTKYYADFVEKPYLDASPHFSSEGWAMSRVEWYQKKKVLGIFKDVKDANKAFREAWLDIVQGKKDVGAVEAILTDVNRFVDQAYSVHESYNNPRTNNLVHLNTTTR